MAIKSNVDLSTVDSAEDERAVSFNLHSEWSAANVLAFVRNVVRASNSGTPVSLSSSTVTALTVEDKLKLFVSLLPEADNLRIAQLQDLSAQLAEAIDANNGETRFDKGTEGYKLVGRINVLRRLTGNFTLSHYNSFSAWFHDFRTTQKLSGVKAVEKHLASLENALDGLFS